MTYDDLKTEYRAMSDSYDKWGSCMEALFECAGHLNQFGLVPCEWDYSPGMGGDGRDEENYWFELFRDTDTDDLLRFGELLHRYEKFLKSAGLSY